MRGGRRTVHRGNIDSLSLDFRKNAYFPAANYFSVATRMSSCCVRVCGFMCMCVCLCVCLCVCAMVCEGMEDGERCVCVRVWGMKGERVVCMCVCVSVCVCVCVCVCVVAVRANSPDGHGPQGSPGTPSPPVTPPPRRHMAHALMTS